MNLLSTFLKVGFCLVFSLLINNFSYCQNNSLQMDDVDDFVELSQHASDLIFDAPATVEFWFKANFDHNGSATEPNSSSILAIGEANGIDGNFFQLWLGNSYTVFDNELLTAQYWIPSPPSYNSHSAKALFSTDNFTNQWHHYAIVMNSNNWSFYLDGIFTNSTVYFPGAPTTYEGLFGDDLPKLLATIGRSIYSTNGYLNGSIDEFRLWNIARSASDIQSNYDKTYNCPQPNLIAYYKFDELEDLGQGNTGTNDVRDYSGNDYHGDVIGGAVPTTNAPVLTPIGLEICNGIDDNCDGQIDEGLQCCISPPSGLVGWWPFEGNGDDLVNGNTATGYGGFSYTTGMVGSGLQLNGIDAHALIPASCSIDVGIFDGFTIETWIKAENLAGAQPIIEFYDDTNINYGVHFWASINSNVQIESGVLYSNIVEVGQQGHIVASSTSVIDENEFTHIALTYDKSTGLANLYADGVLVVQSNIGIFIPETSFDLYFGLRPAGDYPVDQRFKGILDEVSLYSRALTSVEVQGIFDAGGAGKCDTQINNNNGFPDETCNGIDDNCNGLIDDDDPTITGQTTWYADNDNDGFGDANNSILACVQPIGYVADDTDCDDANGAVNPAMTEVCNGIDDNCDGQTDESPDDDNDGFTICQGDCDDSDPAINPNATEVCGNGIDDNCNLQIDEDCGPPLEVDAGDCQVAYYGYAPAECVTLQAITTGGIPPYVYLWDDGTTSPDNEVCPTSTVNYGVTVTDDAGNQVSDAVTVESVDVRCGNNMNKVLICHDEGGTPETLCISPNAVPAHLAHHDDHLGSCGIDPCPGNNNLISFNANVNGQMQTTLHWFTRTLRKAERHIVEKSADGIYFEPLLEREIDIELGKAETFRDIDRNPFEGDNYYRLKIIYFNGSSEYSEIKKVVFNPIADFYIFPNPADDYVNIYLKRFLEKEVDIVIYNTLGNAIYQQHIDKVNDKIITIDLNNGNFKEGIYLVTVIHKGRALSRRMVVAKF